MLGADSDREDARASTEEGSGEWSQAALVERVNIVSRHIFCGNKHTIDTSSAMSCKLCNNSLPNWLRCACYYADEPVLSSILVGQRGLSQLHGEGSVVYQLAIGTVRREGGGVLHLGSESIVDRYLQDVSVGVQSRFRIARCREGERNAVTLAAYLDTAAIGSCRLERLGI